MNTPRNKINRTFSFVPEALEFIDAYSATYGLSKSSTVNQAVLMLKDMIERAKQDSTLASIKVGTAFAKQAQQNTPWEGNEND